MGYVYIAGTIFFTVYGQLILKWQVMKVGNLPGDNLEKVIFLMKLFMNPWVISSFLAAFVASFFWMAAMTKFELSQAYPFMSLSFVLVFGLSIFFFHESATLFKYIGMIFIIVGIGFISQG